MAVGEDFDHAGLVAPVFGKGDFLGDLAVFVEVDDAAEAAFSDHGVAVGEALEGVDAGVFGVVLPSDLAVEGDLGGDRPGVVEEDVSVGEELEVVVTGVASLGAAGVVFPDNGAVRFANGEDVFSVGSADDDEAVFFGEEGEGEQEEYGDELHDGGVFIRDVSWRSFVFVGSFFLRGLIRLRTMGVKFWASLAGHCD